MENVTFTSEEIAVALQARKDAIAAVKAKGIEFMSSGCQLKPGDYTAVIGLGIFCPEFERTDSKGVTKWQSIILQRATHDGENCDFVIQEKDAEKYLPGTTVELKVYYHAASGNNRVKVVSYTGSNAPVISGSNTNSNTLEAEYEALETSLSGLTGIPLAKAKARMEEIMKLV